LTNYRWLIKISKDLDSEISRLTLDFVRVANLLEQEGTKYAQTSGLTNINQYKILTTLSYYGPHSMSSLGKSNLVTKQAMTGTIKKLVAKKLVTVAKQPDDLRVTIVTITKLGREVIDNIKPYRIEGNKQLFSPLSKDEISELSHMLNKLILHMNNIEE